MESTHDTPETIPAAVPTPTMVSIAEADVSTRFDDIYQDITADDVQNVRWRDGAYEFTATNGVALRVQILTAEIVRIRYTPDCIWERDFSYALNPDFQAQKTKVLLTENTNEYVLASDSLQVVVTKQGLRVRIFDRDDRLLSEDEDGFSARRTVMQGWNEVKVTKKCHRKELFYGLGDKSSSGCNLHGKKFQNWCTDAFAFGDQTDPLYRAIPFYYSVYQGVAYGILVDNTFRTHFDFNSRDEGVMSFSAEGGELNYYFIYGPKMADVAKVYAQLTGTHALPPIWALGYHQCKWSYYPEQQVRQLANTFRQLQIPCDAIYLDIDYMDGFRCFTWDEGHFPDPKKMIADLEQQGFKTVVMIDPGLKEDPHYWVYREGMEQGYFVKTAEGPVAKAPVWPGFCVFPDFTNPAVRTWWGQLYEQLYNEQGVAGFWNDMNEPAVFHVNAKTLPDNVLHHYDGEQTNHRKAHNIYGQQMTRASWEGFRALQPKKRPFLLARASYAGGQRYSALWSGDNCASWEHLQIANIQCQRMAISGFSFCGTDIGGFAGDTEGELYTRWLQLSVFHPMMRSHEMGDHSSGDGPTAATTKPVEAVPVPVVAENGNTSSQPTLFDQKETQGQASANIEPPAAHQLAAVDDGGGPWSYGEKWTEIARRAIELRYCLLPVIYTAMWRLTQDGLPALRHIVFADENDPKLWNQDRDFLFGEHLLVSPVVQPKVARQMVYLPKGNWYYFWTGQPACGEMFVNVMPDQAPFFVREGAVLPTYPVRQHTGEVVEEVTLYIYHKNGRETSTWYEDSGEGYDYQQDMYTLREFIVEGDLSNLSIMQVKKGKLATQFNKIKILLVGFPTFVRTCAVDGKEMPIKEIRLRDRSVYTLTLPPDFSTIVWAA